MRSPGTLIWWEGGTALAHQKRPFWHRSGSFNSSERIMEWNKGFVALLGRIILTVAFMCRFSEAVRHSRSHHVKSVNDSGSQIDPQSGIIAQFWTSGTNLKLQHLVYNPSSGLLYVGGTNRLYELDSSHLRIKSEVETGPRYDSPKCHASGCDDEWREPRVLTDNVNKVLVLDPASSMLIMCGSVYQGACEKFRTANISLTPEFIPKSVAANDPNASTYAFVGPEKYNSWGGSEVLYVGTTFTTVGDYRYDVPAISTRNLYNLDYAELTFSKLSVLRIDVKYRDHFLVQYVYGFNVSDYAYFVTVQKKSHLPGQEEAGYISRLARTCITDSNYDSYTEITLECVSGTGNNYNLVQDAKLVSVGSDLAASLGLTPGSPVLIGVFAPSVGHTASAKKSSAMCVFPISEIEAKFNENIHMCFNGSMQYRSMEYISGPILDGKCPEPGTTGNIHNFCEVGLKISGISPLHRRATIQYPEEVITSVQATTTGNHTVAFLGTSVGILKKVLVSSVHEAYEYAENEIDPGSKVLPDMLLHPSGRHIYILTETRLTKYQVESCSSYSNCSSCLEARDPYCGWCSLEKKCTVQSACQKATFSSPRWLSFGAGQQCIDFEMILPDRLPINQMTMVKLTIRTLPELPSGAKYQCVWGTAPPTDAHMMGSGLRCHTPPLNMRPQIPPNEDHALVPLAVRSSETKKDFVSRNFAFYDCTRHRTCSVCVRSAWACNWCVYENLCTHNASACGGTVVSGEKVSIVQLLRENPSQLSSHGSGFCPRFWHDSSELLAADGAKTELDMIVENLPTPRTGQLGFQCMISIEGATMVVDATAAGPPSEEELWASRRNRTVRERRNNHPLQKVLCKPTVFRYEAEEGQYEARVTLVWNREHVVDWRPLTLYKCGVLGAHRGHQDCSLCVTRPAKFRCGWCASACQYSPHCPASAQPLMREEMLNPFNLNIPTTALLSRCPTPRIDVIQPLAGPLEGGTLVTIEGSNLGLKESDVKGHVFIGDVPCQLQEYHVSVRIVCRTGPAPGAFRGSSSNNFQFPVRVATPAGTTESTVKFSYTNISVTGVWPPLGPVSGGTVLSISGKYLNVGSHIRAYLDNLPCIVNKTQSSSHRLVCTTSRGDKYSGLDGVRLPRQIRKLIVTVDEASRVLPLPFTYTPDPTILELKPLRSPWSGGRMLTVHGTHLNSIQSPKITVLLEDHLLNSSSCRVVNPSQMDCPSPSIQAKVVYDLLEELEEKIKRRRRSQRKSLRYRHPRNSNFEEVILDLGFIMDGVEEVRHLRKHGDGLRSSLTYVNDPIYYPFSHGIKLYKGDTLILEGENINLASDESDVRITVGSQYCNITSLSHTQLICIPPESQPLPIDERGNPTPESLPLVVVHVGTHLRFPVGVLRYEKHNNFPLSPEGIAGLAAGVLFMVLGAFIVLALYRRKTSQAERVYKLMQLQMDSLESHVRTECKQAFAELQTDMTDLTADLSSSGIPILDQRSYVMKVFFPGVTDHPILNDPKVTQTPRTNYNVAMFQFEQLLSNKNFLLTFVETLESQKSFNIRDKVNVASLLTVLLLDRMEYLTEVLRSLLLRLVSSTASSKHPQLMLRRTESIVEKMLTNWLALCMYGYLKGDAGTALFLLFKAIKHQVEKGPVDAMTHDARYSLSEEKLLREQVDCHPVTLHLLHDDPHYEKIPYQTATYSVCRHQLHHHHHHHHQHPSSLPVVASAVVAPHLPHTSQLVPTQPLPPSRQTLAVYAEEYEEKVQVKVLDCDTVSQVKAKVLDALYRNTPHSLRPSVDDVDLELRHGRAGRVSLSDEDSTSVTGPGGWRRLNTLSHYGVRDSAVMALVPRQNDSFSSNCTGYYSYANSVTPLSSPSDDLSDPRKGGSGVARPSGGAGIHLYHLVRPTEDASVTSLTGRDSRADHRTYGTTKAIPEIFLTRLLSTKGTVQQFVDDFIRTILSPNDGLPPAVKWLFDLLEESVKNHGIEDPEVIHSWKSNCLPLRFWVNFIKNPDFIFDISKTPTVEACLSVIAQTFVDACSTCEQRLGKDSPSNKLLFAKDIPKYRAQVINFYSDVSRAQPISEQELAQHMLHLSSIYKNQFDNLAALKELYIYVSRYHELILEALDADPVCRSLNLSHRLQSIAYILESYSHGPLAPMPPVQLSGQLSEL